LGKNPTYEKIRSRRTIRKYLQKAVPEEVMLKCVDAARLSKAAEKGLQHAELGWVSARLST